MQDPSTPPVELPDGRVFHVRGAWCDLYEAICNAKHLIYVTGWSIYDKITLVRDPSKPMFPNQWPTLGEAIHTLYCSYLNSPAYLVWGMSDWVRNMSSLPGALTRTMYGFRGAAGAKGQRGREGPAACLG